MRAVLTSPSVTVAVAGVEFGWGSAGKLSAVLSALRERASVPLRFVGLASGIGRSPLAGHPVERWYDLPDAADEVALTVGEIARTWDVRAAVVVLDGVVTKALEAAGVPCVFVDSLPFLWSEADLPALPLEATAYCAQRYAAPPSGSHGVLGHVRALHWVEAVVDGRTRHGGRPPAEPGKPYRTALVSLGGLRAPRLADWTAYPRLVVPAALAALAAYGVEEAHVAGNLPEDMAARFLGRSRSAAPRHTTAGPLAHGDFLDRLRTCDVLVASPGLTTLLEAGGLGVPTVCLPPQNLSQILNARMHGAAVGPGLRVTWPEDVFTEDEVLALRGQGEDRVLERIYGGIAAAAGAPPRARRTSDALGEGVVAALRRSADGAGWGGLTTAVGTGGAAQVADELLAILRRATAPA
ncbi:hydroxymethylcytosylglucuronate/cytosylglucuronate synthase [Streptomyces griseocarneus]|nr:hydroxymethylcytosylglucuronate/cytosylglucuronate synthase [Streptomyces griseocarneus]